MKILYIDLETSGINHNHCQILEVGMIYDPDGNQPIGQLPRFHCYVLPKDGLIIGEPYALALNAEIIKRIDRRPLGYDYVEPKYLADRIDYWLESLGLDPKDPINVCGKNYGTFDRNFIGALPGGEPRGLGIGRYRFRARVIDPAILYYEPTDKALPGTDECLKRAGIDKKSNHTALDDCEIMIQLIRSKLQ